MSYFGTKNADNPAIIGSYSSFFGATFVATDTYCRRLKKYCRRLEKYERYFEKYCRRLKKYERRLEKYCHRLEKTRTLFSGGEGFAIGIRSVATTVAPKGVL